MSIKNLDSLFNPQRIAVVGASEDNKSVGTHLFRNLIGKGFKGVVHPVSPGVTSIQGVEAYNSVNTIPHPIDLAILATHPDSLQSALKDCGKKGVKAVAILAPDYKYRVKHPHLITEQIRKLSSKYGCRVLGPNSLGFLRPAANLNASIYPKMPMQGNISFISESGLFSTAFLEHAISKKVGFSYFISLGSKLDINFADTIDYLGGDGHTRALFLYIQTIKNGRRFMTAIRNFVRNKPIVVIKPGKFDGFSLQTINNSGSLEEEDMIYEAVFKRAGSLRVSRIVDLLYMVETIAKQHRPKGKRLLIISNSIAPSEMAIDALQGMGGLLAIPKMTTLETISDGLSIKRVLRNPLNLLADASAADFQIAIENCLQDKGVDGVLVIYIPFPGIDLKNIAKAIASAANSTPTTPLFTTWYGEETSSAEIDFLNDNNIPTYHTTEQAVRSFMYMYRYDYNLKLLRETPEIILKDFSPDLQHAEEIIQTCLEEKRVSLHGDEAENILRAYGINARVITQPMMIGSGYELAVGAKKSISFGTVIKFGLGGKYLKAEKDYSIGLPPLNQTLARRMMEETKIFRYLQGCPAYQNSLRSLEEMLVRFSQLIIDLPQIGEIDINPLLLTKNEAVVRGVTIHIDTSLPKEYRWTKGDLCPLHLSIPPYPFKYEKDVVLKDGTDIHIRPIRGEDEPIMRRFFEALSAESVFYRFGLRRINMPHDNLVRFCQVDYDRDIAFLALVQEEGKDEVIIGDVRLNRFADLDSAELSFVVADQWQGQGVGGILMNYCIMVAGDIGIKTLLMEILKNNSRMIKLGYKYNFKLTPSSLGDDMEEMVLDIRDTRCHLPCFPLKKIYNAGLSNGSHQGCLK